MTIRGRRQANRLGRLGGKASAAKRAAARAPLEALPLNFHTFKDTVGRGGSTR